MTTPINGVLGGLLVGLLAAGLTRLVIDGPLPTPGPRAWLDVGGPNPWWAAVVGTCYGGLAGGSLVAVELHLLGWLAVPPTTVDAFTVAVAWSVLLFALTSAGSWVSSVADRAWLFVLLVYHVVFGVGLGLWIRLTWIT